jgi:hypothetical protein
MANQDMFDRVLNRIADDPESFDMRHWYKQDTCGTHACLAGFTILEAGYTPWLITGIHYASSLGAEECSAGGKLMYIEDVARKCLGLTQEQAELLFDAAAIAYLGYAEEHAPRNVEEISMRWKAVTNSG